MCIYIYIYIYIYISPNQRLTSNWSISWSFRLTHRPYLQPSVLTDLNTESGNFWTAAAIDCLRAVSNGMISVGCRDTIFLIRTHRFRTAKKLFLLYSFSSLGTPDSRLRNPVWETQHCPTVAVYVVFWLSTIWYKGWPKAAATCRGAYKQ